MFFLQLWEAGKFYNENRFNALALSDTLADYLPLLLVTSIGFVITSCFIWIRFKALDISTLVRLRPILLRAACVGVLTFGFLFLVGVVLNFGSGSHSRGNQSTVSVAKEFVEYVIKNENNIYDWSKNDADKFWEGTLGAYAFMDAKDGRGYPKPGFENTHKLQSFIIEHAKDIRLDLYAKFPPLPRERFRRKPPQCFFKDQ